MRIASLEVSVFNALITKCRELHFTCGAKVWNQTLLVMNHLTSSLQPERLNPGRSFLLRNTSFTSGLQMNAIHQGV